MKSILLIIVLFFSLKTYCQLDKKLNWLKDSIGYDVRKYIGENQNQVSSYKMVVFCTKKQKRQFRKLTKENLISLLQDSDRVFATNLMLYELYGRDSEWYFYNSLTSSDWKEKKQRTEVEYWSEFISNR